MKVMKPAALAGAITLLFLPLQANAELLPCEAFYSQGVEAFQNGDYQLAERYLIEAAALSPEADSDGQGYLPYLYLAASRYELGSYRGARDALIQSQVYGAAAELEKGRDLIEQYAVSIMSAPMQDDPAMPQSSPALAPAQGGLSELDAQIVRARVLRRCALSSDIAENKLPWYFHYLLGLEYSERGDNGRAVHAFQMGANLETESARNKRLYGMWFMDYLPYYQMALAHVELGEWTAARNALYTALEVGEFEEGANGWSEFQSMEAMLDRELGKQGG